jgi:hypothetical protein
MKIVGCDLLRGGIVKGLGEHAKWRQSDSLESILLLFVSAKRRQPVMLLFVMR